MKKAGIPWKLFFILSLITLLILLAPMIKAAQYDVPSEDDFPYGLEAHLTWVSTGSLWAVLQAIFRRVRSVYFTHQGSFSAIFLFCSNPMIFGEQYYTICPLVIMCMLIAGNFLLTYTVSSGIFKASRSQSGILAVIITVICTQFLPRASQGIYWYNGAVYYTFFFGLAEIALSLLLRCLIRNGRTLPGNAPSGENHRDFGRGWFLAAESLLLLIVGGGNLVTGLTTAVLLVSMMAMLIYSGNADWKMVLIPVLFFFIGFGINVGAPGNSVRQTYFVKPGLINSVPLSFRNAGLFFYKWFSLPVIALILMTIPVLWHIASRTEFRFVKPGLVSLYSVCLAGVMFYPPIYAMGESVLPQVSRILNIIFFGEVFLVVFNLFYWIGWLQQRGIFSEKRFPLAEKGRYSLMYLLVMLAVFVFGMTRIQWFDTTSISAFRSYRSGQMGNYYHTYKQRLEILKDPNIKDAVLKRFPYRPYVLFYKDLYDYPEGNQHLAIWYGKNSVIIH